ncbi:exodeoxyribonuclease V subunit beta [Vibrio sp. SS-MA-C1-2]|uniref:exodeoxyribonuclease V subunit beta n=1 Tax=Vibrio sp. SS-MA-C1-2 TaxID=2908646 RepID=UPI001F3E4442|nr:exodeoxyribonuclease V subunit beta [Vibrio sp. SS-MA-C1-2]UJF18926.1 exodeoxyribonuclease V subunit beta [Vibrio sp. SS-MA-C1-2]
MTPTQLNPMTFPLYGTRLIEASAGTGKTFTIASLYLRLLLGHGDPIAEEDTKHQVPLTVDQILVVTFTEAATEELRDRIRARIHQMRIALQKQSSHDGLITQLMGLIDDPKEAISILLQAERQMDEAAIYTIHGFCQRMLTQNAFESGSLFNNEFITDELQIRQLVAADYWRKNFYELSPDIARLVTQCWQHPNALLADINRYISGAEIAVKAPSLDQGLTAFVAEQLKKITQLKQQWKQARGEFVDLFADSKINRRSYSKTTLPKWLTAVDEWADEETVNFQLPDKLAKFGQDELREKSDFDAAPEHTVFQKIDQLYKEPPEIKSALQADAIAQCRQQLIKAKQRQGWLSFDDLLTQLSCALLQDSDDLLANKIRELFPVAMIDEFQDTDPMQYAIFSTIYQGSSESGLFMIGDPKQAIYGFRGADIFTYMAARNSVAAHYTLGTNWRSSEDMVNAVNALFQFADSPFIYDQDIPFYPVNPNPKANGLSWALDGQRQPALTLWHDDRQQDLISKGDYQVIMANATVSKIQQLLEKSEQGEAYLAKQKEDGEQRTKIEPSNIAVLVRTGSEGQLIKRLLAKQGVASVYLSNRESVFSQPIAQDLYRLLMAVMTPENERLLRSALASTLFGLSAEQLDQLNIDEFKWELVVAEFNDYQQLLQKRGVMPMLRAVLARREIAERLLMETSGERIVTDLLHVGELLQQASQELDSHLALVRWLSEKISTPNGNAEDQQVRLESERNLVQIVTIHKSKGLEYDLVFLPFACNARKSETPLYHNPNEGTVLDYIQQDDALVAAERERLAEDLRLIYVALTRAVYGCFIGMAPIRDGRKAKGDSGVHLSAMGWLIQNGEAGDAALLSSRLNKFVSEHSQVAISQPEQVIERIYCEPEMESEPISALSLQRQIANNWWITSYSGLVKQGHNKDASFEIGKLDIEDQSNDAALQSKNTDPANLDQSHVDQNNELSIFTFPKGAKPGTFLHSLFEEIEFTDSEHHQDIIANLMERDNIDPKWLPILVQLVSDTLAKSLDGEALTLSSIGKKQRLTEMEFVFPISQLSSSMLNKVIAEHDPLSRGAGELKFHLVSGMLKGFIDLIFEYQGRYYILDWKSNWLGEEKADYSQQAMRAAMSDHRYDFQYQIYALALHRFLQQRIKNYDYQQHFGGVYYLFLRGIEQQSDNGIFYTKPSFELLEKLDQVMSGQHYPNDLATQQSRSTKQDNNTIQQGES